MPNYFKVGLWIAPKCHEVIGNDAPTFEMFLTKVQEICCALITVMYSRWENLVGLQIVRRRAR